MEYKELANFYLTVGAGGLCVILVAWVVIFQIKTLNNKLTKLEANQEITNEILRSTNDMMSRTVEVISKNQEIISGNQKALDNNTEAMKNFSLALQDFSGSLNVQNDKLRDIENCSHDIAINVVKISERVKPN